MYDVTKDKKGYKVHFEPSTLETIDRSVLRFVKRLSLSTETNEGWKEVPVVWSTAERAFQVKQDSEIRDKQGMLKLPIIAIHRSQVTKTAASKGIYQGTLPAFGDEQGGALEVNRVLYQGKTLKFANADSKRLTGQLNFPRENGKIVYRTITAPMPVNINVTYEITLRTEYQQQMNELILPFITKPGTINYISLPEGEHRYEGFIQEDYSSSDNLADHSSEERKFETKITLEVVGYLIGEGKNSEKPHYAIRENAVEVKIPRERVSLSEIPEHEYGAYYGLAGIPPSFDVRHCPMPYLFSNLPAVGSGGSSGASSAGAGGAGNPSGDTVTKSNFAEVLAEQLVIRKVIKAPSVQISAYPSSTVFTISGDPIRLNTEALYRNGMMQSVGAGNDYTISGNTITFLEAIEDHESIYITYIVG